MSVNEDRRGSLELSLKKVEAEEEQNENEDTTCGIGNFHPSWLQKFNTPKAFLVNNGFLGLLNGATFTYFIGCISTLEKRYSFESKVTGIIMIGEEISPICFGFLIGYFGGKSHRPRFIALALTIGFLSALVMASPYFLYGAIREVSKLDHYKNRTDFELCDSAEKDYFCDKFPTLTAVTIFFIGTFMKGFAVNAFYTIGTPYLDDNVKKKNTAMYFATSMTIQLLGPASGFLLSSLCLQFYEDPFYDPGYGTDDPRWIGAWWLGYIIIGLLMLLFSLPMWLFPRRFPGVKVPKPLPQKQDSKAKTGILKNMGNAILRLIRNPILIFHQLGGIFRVNGVIGYFILMPKYMEMQFQQSASKANLFSGPISIVGMMFGILIGGGLVRRFKPRPRILTGGLLFAESFGLLALLISMQINCQPVQTDQESSFTSTLMNLENDCNRDCLCTTKSYTPICGPDKKTTYFSPCYAGCNSYNNTEDDKEIFSDCKCVHNSEGEVNAGEALKGYCNFECQWLVLYIAVICVGRFMSSTTGVASALVFLRCVDPADKSAALGALSGVYSILAFIPYPILFGALSDSCCLVWEHSCGKTGNCWIYDIEKFRYMLHGVSAIFIFLGSCTDIVVWYLSPRLKNIYSDEETHNGDQLDEVNGVLPDVSPLELNGISNELFDSCDKMAMDQNELTKNVAVNDFGEESIKQNDRETIDTQEISRC
ncbi:solute carrier organic anion transporter family member 74D isoform X2 [Parasteatoda tepidariorum]|uniref:solute carrier organic anion transporter family member 74D isoform X2 n=1 Tax=Parasteatoda tepidariorum TaxID=114398 RepID=UPI0039BD4E64